MAKIEITLDLLDEYEDNETTISIIEAMLEYGAVNTNSDIEVIKVKVVDNVNQKGDGHNE